MIHDPDLLETLSGFESREFGGAVYRACRMNLDPLAFSSQGGRWARPQTTSVLYTSFERDGALAEVCYHWSLFTPLPTKPANVHTLAVTANSCLRLLKGELGILGVSAESLGQFPYPRTQEIGSAVAFLEHDGLIVPSARWDCHNLILFQEHHSLEECQLEVVSTEEVNWQEWARGNGLL